MDASRLTRSASPGERGGLPDRKFAHATAHALALWSNEKEPLEQGIRTPGLKEKGPLE